MEPRYQTVRPSLGSTVVGLAVFALAVYLLVRVAAFTVSTLLSGLPVFFGIGALLFGGAYLVDARVPRGFVQWLGATLRAEPLRGVLLGAATVLFAPFVGAYLLGKALLIKRVRSAVGDLQARAAEQMRERARAAGTQRGALGDEAGAYGAAPDHGDYTEVRQDDGLVIRIPKGE